MQVLNGTKIDNIRKTNTMHFKVLFSFFLALIISGLSVSTAYAQDNDGLDEEEQILLQTGVFNGDTLPLVLLQPVAIVASKDKRDAVAEYKYRRLKKNVMKVYPYAKEAARIIAEIDAVTADLDKKRHQKKYLKQLEKDLKATFEDELRNLTISQGKALTRLVSRETGISTHQLIKEYKSGVSAAFWNTIAKRFGYDLKTPFDPVNNPVDKDIDEIASSLEASGL